MKGRLEGRGDRPTQSEVSCLGSQFSLLTLLCQLHRRNPISDTCDLTMRMYLIGVYRS